MRGPITCIVSAVLAALALCSNQVRAAEAVVGSVLAVRGTVLLDSGAAVAPLAINAPVHRGDAIISTAGKAKIVFNDGTIVSVGENSRVRIADYQTSADSVKTRVNLVSGVLRLLVAKLTAQGRFEVETETALAAVRGTDWAIEASSEQTSVTVVSGAVSVSGQGPQAQTMVILEAPGQGTDVRRGLAPTPPKQWATQRFNDLVGRATFD